MLEARHSVIRTARLAGAGVLVAALGATAAEAQRRPPRTLAYAHEDVEGFTPIFDGRTLDGWDGDPRLWRVEGGVIVGESTATNPVEENTFLIWRGGAREGVVRDFELKLEFRLVGGQENSGVQVRSGVRPDAAHQWRLTGYQVDMDYDNNYTGMVYGEGAGGFLAPRGEITYVMSGRERPQNIGTLGGAEDLASVPKAGEWNTLHIIFRGNTLINLVNGRVTSVLVDDDLEVGGGPRLAEGLIGFQLHTGPPMRVEFRNVYLKEYAERP